MQVAGVGVGEGHGIELEYSDTPLCTRGTSY